MSENDDDPQMHKWVDGDGNEHEVNRREMMERQRARRDD